MIPADIQRRELHGPLRAADYSPRNDALRVGLACLLLMNAIWLAVVAFSPARDEPPAAPVAVSAPASSPAAAGAGAGIGEAG